MWGKMVNDKEVNITFDTLFEILRREKSRDELQKLDSSFFHDVAAYITEKKSILETQSEDNLFAQGEREKNLRELDNIKRILKELYERRERKIISTAINKSRLQSNLVDTSALLKEERLFFEAMVSLLNNFRHEVLHKIVLGHEPGMKCCQVNIDLSDIEDRKEAAKPKEIKKEGMTKIRFLKDTEQFIGPELENYGPYEEDDTAELPDLIVKALVSKGNAEEIKE